MKIVLFSARQVLVEKRYGIIGPHEAEKGIVAIKTMHCRCSPRTMVAEIKSLNVTVRTAQRIMNSTGLKAFKKTRKPEITPEHARKRLEYAMNTRIGQLKIGKKYYGQ